MKYCMFCGKQLADDARFCIHCGKAQGPNGRMFEDVGSQFDEADREKNRVLCALSYIPPLFFLSLINGDSRYAKLHANQSFAFFLAMLVVFALGRVFTHLSVLLSLALVAAAICMLVFTLTGRCIKFSWSDKFVVFK